MDRVKPDHLTLWGHINNIKYSHEKKQSGLLYHWCSSMILCHSREWFCRFLHLSLFSSARQLKLIHLKTLELILRLICKWTDVNENIWLDFRDASLENNCIERCNKALVDFISDCNNVAECLSECNRIATECVASK